MVHPGTRVTIHYLLPLKLWSGGVVGTAGINRGILYSRSVVCGGERRVSRGTAAGV